MTDKGDKFNKVLMSQKYMGLEIYRTICKMLGLASEIQTKEKLDPKYKRKISVCRGCRNKMFKLSKKRSTKYVNRTKKDPFRCAFCKAKLSPPYMRKTETLDLN